MNMNDRQMLQARADKNPNSTAAIIIMREAEFDAEARANRKSAVQAFFAKIFGRAK